MGNSEKIIQFPIEDLYYVHFQDCRNWETILRDLLENNFDISFRTLRELTDLDSVFEYTMGKIQRDFLYSLYDYAFSKAYEKGIVGNPYVYLEKEIPKSFTREVLQLCRTEFLERARSEKREWIF